MADSQSLSDLSNDLGPARTRGKTFRARAEARQREYRTNALRVGFQRYGHLLSPEAAEAGHNFVHPAALAAVRERAAAGRGIHRERTFANMLSSQAMSFNVFAPLATPDGLPVAALLLRRFVPDIASVTSIRFEVTPPPELFRDSADCSGVCCDLIIEYTSDTGSSGLIAVENMFVETEFCTCAFRSAGQPTPCTVDMVITDAFAGCRYVSHKGFSFFDSARKLGTLKVTQTKQARCPFGGPMWQLYINHTLTHALAAQKHISKATFALCAPVANERLHAQRQLVGFSEFLNDKKSAVFLPLEDVIRDLARLVPPQEPWRSWIEKLKARYVVE